jgi:hypothetical protein
MSDDGRYQYYSAHLDTAVAGFEPYHECLFRSDDYGATWTPAVDFTQIEFGAASASPSDSLDWDELVCSSDGATVVVGGRNTWNYGGIMRSTDYGETWSETHLGAGKSIRSLAMTGDASRLACAQISDVLTSTDLGATWTEVDGPRIGYKEITPNELIYSRDGTNLVAFYTSYTNGSNVFTSSDHGASWTAKHSWARDLVEWSWAVSTNASRMFMADGKYILKSVDGGSTWTTLPGLGPRSWSFLSLSRDGRYQLACSSLSSSTDEFISDGWVYRSADSGQSWTRVDALGEHAWNFLSASDDGQRMVAGYYFDDQYLLSVSTDGGASWSAPVSVVGYGDESRGSAISSDGRVIALVSQSGADCYLSTDGGSSWNAISACSSTYGVRAVAVSGDGQIVTIVGVSNIWQSSDSGSTWTSRSFTAYGDKADISDDGNTIAISHTGGYVWLSKDCGVSWEKIMVPGANSSAEDANSCVGVAVSPDGRGIAVVTGRTTVSSYSGSYASSAGSVLITMDGGANWTRAAAAGARVWTNIAASQDFCVIAAAARETGDGILVSR